MNLKQSVMWQAASLAVSVLVSALAAPMLPSRVPTHWGIEGKPDAWGSPAFALGFGPGMIAAILVLTLAMPWLPAGKNFARFPGTYCQMMAILGGFFGFLHLTILFATLRGGDLPGIFMMGMFLFFAAMGNLMGKIKPNPYMGIRTPWTMSNERVWEVSHRRAAYIYVGGGIVGAIVTLFEAPMGVQMGWLMLFTLYPVLDSYLVSVKIKRGG